MHHFSSHVLTAATKAVFELQYNSAKAAHFVCSQVPNTNMETALAAISKVAKGH